MDTKLHITEHQPFRLHTLGIDNPKGTITLLQTVEPNRKPACHTILSKLLIENSTPHEPKLAIRTNSSLNSLETNDLIILFRVTSAATLSPRLELLLWSVLHGGDSIDMEFNLEIRLKTLLPTISGREWEILTGDDFNSEIKSLICGERVDGEGEAVAFGFEDIAAFARKEGFVEHHAVVNFLPIEGDKLAAQAPVGGWIGIVGGEAEAERVDTG
jgi:hypothetical protein